jgi:hypothetical protein
MSGAAVLVIAGAPKVLGPARAGLLPAWTWRPVGALELVVGAWALVAPESGGAWAAAALYALLTVAMVVAIARDEPDCGCFGTAAVRPDPLHLGVDAVFAIACAVGAVQGWSPPEPAWATVAAVVAALISGTAIVSLLSHAAPSGGR